MTVKSAKSVNSGFFSNLGNVLLVLLLKMIAQLPFTCIYALSDLLYFMNKAIFRYRFVVTENNLRCAFPDKTDEEINELKSRFYRHFFDVSLESVKLYHTSEKQLKQRIVFKGLKELEWLAAKEKGAIILAFHYNNWEWCTYGQQQLKYPVLMVYNPPRHNKPMENFLKQSRGRWGGKVIRTNWAARTVLKYKQNGDPAILWLAADQTALASSPFWINFLNREAAFFKGPMVLAQKTNFPVFFQHIKKIGRGKYEAEYSMLLEQPAALKPEEIVKAYVQKMEEVINSRPEYYLWSHNRWKHKRPANTPLIG